MQYNELIAILLRQLPSLAPGYQKLVDRHKAINETPGVHVVYGDLFCDYLIEIARSGDAGRQELKNLASWIEEMAGSQDQEVRNLVEVSILERLVDDKVDAIIPFLGPNSAKLIRRIGERLNLAPGTWGQFL